MSVVVFPSSDSAMVGRSVLPFLGFLAFTLASHDFVLENVHILPLLNNNLGCLATGKMSGEIGAAPAVRNCQGGGRGRDSPGKWSGLRESNSPCQLGRLLLP